MAEPMVVNDFIRLRDKADDSKESGLTVQLLPDGGTAPGDLITITQNAGIDWQYDFPVGVTNGLYKLYIGGVIAKNNGVDIEVYAIRGGVVSTAEADFAKDSW